ncbi:MAG: zinc ribbon domain-containing protein [Candidatus Dojkabacteria bacterium]|nr:MAG: zinc ribbon domain-containing protein [Candidatus Dojkabacteria bacterium]
MDFEQFLLGFLEGNAQVNYNALIYTIGVGLVLLWVFYIFWVWNDASQRSTNLFFRIGSLLLVTLLSYIGLIIYLVIRPKFTIEQIYWMDLERRYLIFETADLRDCVSCGYQLRPEFNSCPQCGNAINVPCEQCNEMINRYWKFCPYCAFQARDRRAPVEEVISQEVMEKSIEESAQEAVEHVESKKARYARQTSIAASIGNWVIAKVMVVGKMVDRFMRRTFGMRKRPAAVAEAKEATELNGRVVIDTQFTKSKKKKDKRKKRKKKRR